MNFNENSIVEAVIDFFTKDTTAISIRELQLCEKFIDIYIYDYIQKKYIAVEAKVNATSKAFDQASKYVHVAEYVYVAILKNSSNKKAIELSHKTGIGLILVEKNEKNEITNVEIAIEAKKSKYFNEKLTAKVLAESIILIILCGEKNALQNSKSNG